MTRVSRFEVRAVLCASSLSAIGDDALLSAKHEAPGGRGIKSLQSYNNHHVTPSAYIFEGFAIRGG